MAEVIVKFGERAVGWDLTDEQAAVLLQNFVQFFGPGKEVDPEEEIPKEDEWTDVWAYHEPSKHHQHFFHLECKIEGYFHEYNYRIDNELLARDDFELWVWRELISAIEHEHESLSR